jgi:hypothetical protein
MGCVESPWTLSHASLRGYLVPCVFPFPVLPFESSYRGVGKGKDRLWNEDDAETRHEGRCNGDEASDMLFFGGLVTHILSNWLLTDF